MGSAGLWRIRCFSWLTKSIALLLIVFLSGLLLWNWMRPRFEGKTLDQWVRRFPAMVDGAGNEIFKDEHLRQLVVEAGRGVRALGPRALSRLEQELRAEDSTLGLARFDLEVRWMNTLRREPSYVPGSVRRARAMLAMGELGEAAAEYGNELKSVVTNSTESHFVRAHARWALEKIAPRQLSAEEHRWCDARFGWCALNVADQRN